MEKINYIHVSNEPMKKYVFDKRRELNLLPFLTNTDMYKTTDEFMKMMGSYPYNNGEVYIDNDKICISFIQSDEFETMVIKHYEITMFDLYEMIRNGLIVEVMFDGMKDNIQELVVDKIKGDVV